MIVTYKIIEENGKWNIYKFRPFNWVISYFNKLELVESFGSEEDAKNFKIK